MRIYRTPLILLLLIIFLGVISYWDEMMTKQEKAQEAQLHQLLTGNIDEIVGFFYEKNVSDEVPLRLKIRKDADDWFIVQPLQAKADEALIRSTLQSVLEYRYERKLDGDTFQLDQYGLTEPRFRITINFADGDTQVLSVGQNLPIGYSSYLNINNSDHVFVGSQFITAALNKNLHEFRSKNFPLPRSGDLLGMEYQNQAGERVVLSRDEAEWVMKEPESIRADQDEVEEFLRTIRQTQVREFLDDPSPAIRQALSLNNKGTEKLGSLNFIDRNNEKLQLVFLRNAEDVYTSWDGQDTYQRVEKKLELLFQKTAWDFRYKDVFNFDSNQAQKVVINNQAYEKRLHNWYREDEPDSPRFYDHVRRFLVDLEFAKAKELLDENSVKSLKLNQAIYNIAILINGDVEIKAEIWKLEGEDSVLIKKVGDPTYYLVGSGVIEDIFERQETGSEEEEEMSHDS